MRPGELWALDTSYEHSVRNRSDQVRVHLVVDVVANDWVWSLLPKKGVAYYRHLAGFWTVACWMGLKKLRADRRFLARNLRGLARRVLEGEGYDVLEASTAEEALALADEAERRIDLLLTDYRLPEMRGPELARRLTERRPDLITIYMSGYGEEALEGEELVP